MGNEELVNIYEKRLGDAGYLHFKLGRTNNRGDGIFFPIFFFGFVTLFIHIYITVLDFLIILPKMGYDNFVAKFEEIQNYSA